MKTQVLIAAIAILVLADTAISQEIYQKKDNFDGTTRYFTKSRDVKLEGGSFISMRYAQFSFHALSPAANPQSPYFLDVHTNTPAWIFIDPGASLILKLDGQEMMTITGPGSVGARTVVTADSLVENALYPLSEDQLQRIGRAKKVDFRIIGDRQIITGTWKADLITDADSLAQKGPGLLSLQSGSSAVLTNAAPTPHLQTCASTPSVKLGVAYVLATKQLADTLHMQNVTGVVVASIQPGSVADTSGVHVGDVMLRLGERPITALCDVSDSLAKVEKGSKVSIGLWRAGAESVVEAQF